ncbi:TRAP transporter substrate-binding protein DctP [Geomicrobium sp. JCM 19038]|uniref:TRAP transporter substrate-binding protein DctP n=1 Tax=Geomicrobium sp. JCM 19038 TaxID=1460635 RepID=UPI00045F1F74|nr:TRAP transporter substrate-binding protein DctP [Geomicrobium sp. JCM 19038]GAK09881.1 TRAP-type C4-dicarboxylate transport system, periplasmic component [Geomicrobium sp. JCM 19038]
MATSSEKTYEMIMTSEVPESHFKSQLMMEFAEEIERRTDGGIQVEFFAAGQLYKDISAVRSLGTGAVHSVWPISSQLESIDNGFGILALPFAITDDNMLKTGYRLELVDILSELLTDQDISIQGLIRSSDLMYISEREELTSMEDLKGKKVRLTGSVFLLNLAETLGYSAVAISASEMSTSLSQGVIDAVFTSADGWLTVLGTSVEYGYHAPGKNVQTYSILFDQRWLDDLPEDYRYEVESLAQEIAARQWAEAMQKEEEIIEVLLEEGVTIHTETEENIEKMKEDMQPAVEKFGEENQQLYDRFLQLERTVEEESE